MKKWEIMLASVILSGSLAGTVNGQEVKDVPGEPAAEVAVEYAVEFVAADEASAQEDPAQDESTAEDSAKSDVVVSGKVIVIGPDGKKIEYKIGEQLPEGLKVLLSPQIRQSSVILQSESKGDFAVEPQTAEVRAITVTGEAIPGSEVKVEQRLMIGVHCEAASDLLRGHLKLENKGLVIIETVPDSPAAAVGLQKNDLLLKVNDQELSEVTDLLDAVTKSEGKELSVSLLRAGDPMTLQVTPKLMEVPEQVVFSVANSEDMKMLDMTDVIEREELPEHVREMLKSNPGMMRLRMITPGSVMIDKGASQEEIEKMLQHAAAAARDHAAAAQKHAEKAAEAAALEAQHAERVQKRAVEVHKKAQHDRKSVDQKLQELQEQINALKEQVRQSDAKEESENEKQ